MLLDRDARSAGHTCTLLTLYEPQRRPTQWIGWQTSPDGLPCFASIGSLLS